MNADEAIVWEAAKAKRRATAYRPSDDSPFDQAERQSATTRRKCEHCGRKMLIDLTDTYAIRDGLVSLLDGATCGICLRADGFSPVDNAWAARRLAETMS